MCLFLSALLGAFLFACSSDNPLAERVANLEQELSEVKAAQEEDRLSLLARLDALAVTADNAEEIGAVRAKLNQTSITRSEFTQLANRVTALERQIVDWTGIVRFVERSVYAVIHEIYEKDGESDYAFVGTAFAVKSNTLVTNGHVIDALVEWDAEIEAWNRENGTEFQVFWLVAQNLTTSLDYKQNYFVIWEYSYHSQWDNEDINSPDVGTLQILDGHISRRTILATYSEVFRLKVGAPIATLGFPGELQGFRDLGALYPIATFKNGTISALRPRFEGYPYNAPRDTYIVQHNLDLSGGTSGSPIFDVSGKVVAINNAGIDYDVLDVEGGTTRVGQAALGFGIRADKIHELLNEAGVAAKRTTHVNFSELANRLDGRDIRSLNIATTRKGLVERLERLR